MKYSFFWARVPVETLKSSSFCSSKKWTKMPHKQQDYFSIETDNIIFSGQCQRCFASKVTDIRTTQNVT